MAGLLSRSRQRGYHTVYYQSLFVRHQTPRHRVRSLSTEETSTLTGRVRGRAWRAVKGVLILTGGLVWVSTLARLYRRRNGVDKSPGNVSSVNEFFGLTEKGLRDKHNVEELVEKNKALHDLWDRLRKEDSVEERFGSPSEICGFRLHNWRNISMTNTADEQSESSDENEFLGHEGGTKWTRSFIVEGPKLVGQLDTTFELVNDAWVPTAVKLEGLSREGTTLVDVAAPPPNGVSRFTRLSVLKIEERPL